MRSKFGDFFASLCKKDDKFTESDLMRLLAASLALSLNVAATDF
jgi:hypothetical protein